MAEWILNFARECGERKKKLGWSRSRHKFNSHPPALKYRNPLSSLAFTVYCRYKNDGERDRPLICGTTTVGSNSNHTANAGGAGSHSHNALRMNYITNRPLSRDRLVVSGVGIGESTVS